MGNRYPISTVYFCGNCEEEVAGLPAGSRILSGRPLCIRCTQIGVEEGWASFDNLSPDERISMVPRKPGAILLVIMLCLTGIALFAATAVFGPPGRR
jgi:hypothetical protein